jgi:mRNA-degrading endonuclease RelE of RelBE toxin-antitoxin system
MLRLHTIVELHAFARDVKDLLENDQVDELKGYLAENPEAGAVIPGAGGVRKLRWSASGRGTRGGARVIYYYLDREMPLYLISIFAKSQKTDLNAGELKAARQFAEAIKEERKKRK